MRSETRDASPCPMSYSLAFTGRSEITILSIDRASAPRHASIAGAGNHSKPTSRGQSHTISGSIPNTGSPVSTDVLNTAVLPPV